MLTQSLNTPVIGNKVSPVAYPAPHPTSSARSPGMPVWWRPSSPTGRTRKSTARMSRRNMFNQVITGAVRSYKLLSDGRRQIGAFHLPGDVFGLESGTVHRLAAEAIIDTTVRLGEAPQPRTGRRRRRPGGPQALGDDRGRPPPRGRPYAAARTQDRDGAGRHLPARNGRPARRRRHDGAADVPPGYRRLSRPDAGDRLAGAVATPRPGHPRGSPAPARSCCATARSCAPWTPERTDSPADRPFKRRPSGRRFRIRTRSWRTAPRLRHHKPDHDEAHRATPASPVKAVPLPNRSLT